MAAMGEGTNHKIDSMDCRASDKMSASEVMHNSDSRSSTFQAEALSNGTPFKINIVFKTFSSIYTKEISILNELRNSDLA